MITYDTNFICDGPECASIETMEPCARIDLPAMLKELKRLGWNVGLSPECNGYYLLCPECSRMARSILESAAKS